MEALSPDIAKKLLNRDVANLVARVQKGGKLTRAERAMLQSLATGTGAVPTTAANLLADDVVAKSFNLNLSAPGVTDALIKRLAGFDLHETVVIPSDHAEKLVGFAVHPSAVAVAMRYLQPVADYQQAGAVTDPNTGMTFGYLRFTDTRANKVFVTIECLYGFTVAKNDALKRLVKP